MNVAYVSSKYLALAKSNFTRHDHDFMHHVPTMLPLLRQIELANQQQVQASTTA